MSHQKGDNSNTAFTIENEHIHTLQDAYLLHTPAASASERHRVSAVVIGSHRSHAVVLVHVKRDALDGGGAP